MPFRFLFPCVTWSNEFIILLLKSGPNVGPRRVISYHGGGGGGGSRLNFGQGCAAHCFKIAPLARPIFLKMIPLARLISTSKCHELAFSRQNLPNFCILWTKI